MISAVLKQGRFKRKMILDASSGQTNAVIVAAVIAASVAVVGGVVNLIAAYRLKLKEFRVTQIKSRIDALEQAGVSSGPESEQNRVKGTPALKTLEETLGEGVYEIWRAALYRFDETEKQFAKCKWLLNSTSHADIDELLMQCKKQASPLPMAAMKDRQEFAQLFLPFVDCTENLRKAFEDARLSTIKGMYLILNKDLGLPE
jgi:hypothetical protein